MKPAYDFNGVTLYQGDSAEILKALPDASVHCVITSPPVVFAQQLNALAENVSKNGAELNRSAESVNKADISEADYDVIRRATSEPGIRLQQRDAVSGRLSRSAASPAGQNAGGESVKLTIVPTTLDEANAFVRLHHRHHLPSVGHKFAIAVADEAGNVRGVAIVGRPVARHLDDTWTLEVNRVATDGCPNACSALYASAWRAARALGYRRLITYILTTEPGTSLRAAGWRCVGEAGGGSWSSAGRPRVDKHPLQKKLRFEVEADYRRLGEEEGSE